MRILLVALLLLGLIAGPAVAPENVSALADAGNPAVSRLWVLGDPYEFNCTGWYLAPVVVNKSMSPDGTWKPDWSDNERSLSWIVSAGHCAESYTIDRDLDSYIKGYIDWVAVLSTGTNVTHAMTDLAVGKVPDTRAVEARKYLKLADKDAESGDRVTVHGFPQGIERIVQGTVSHLQNPMMPGATYVEVTGRDDGLWGGASGAPVLNGHGRVVGVLWGVSFEADPTNVPRSPYYGETQFPGFFRTPEDVKWALFTPVSRLKAMLKLLGAHGYHE